MYTNVRQMYLNKHLLCVFGPLCSNAFEHKPWFVCQCPWSHNCLIGLLGDKTINTWVALWTLVLSSPHSPRNKPIWNVLKCLDEQTDVLQQHLHRGELQFKIRVKRSSTVGHWAVLRLLRVKCLTYRRAALRQRRAGFIQFTHPQVFPPRFRSLIWKPWITSALDVKLILQQFRIRRTQWIPSEALWCHRIIDFTDP